MTYTALTTPGDSVGDSPATIRLSGLRGLILYSEHRRSSARTNALGGAFLSRAVTLAMVLVLLAGAAGAQTRSVADHGTVPSGMAPGSPAGSYSLSDIESINVYNGGLNVTLPLLKVGGRGSAGHTITLRIKKTPWTVEHRVVGFACGGGEGGDPNCYLWDALVMPQWWTPVEPGYDPGVVQGRRVGSDEGNCPFAGGPPAKYGRTFSVITFTAPDGTEHALYDVKYGGDILSYDMTCQQFDPDPDRGRVFSAKDGSGLTFISDEAVSDNTNPQLAVGSGLFWPAGYLKTADGSVYRYENARAVWMRDRNGNAVTFGYDNFSPNSSNLPAYRRLVKVTDSLGRMVNISYGVQDQPQYGTHDRISYRGFDGAERIIRVSRTALSQALRPNSGYQHKQVNQLFPQLPSSGYGHFDPGVVSAVWLPDGVRHFRLYYNEYNELARLELPTGGAAEYDYWAGVSSPWSTNVNAYASGQVGDRNAIAGRPEKIFIYRRLRERRLYPDGGGTPVLRMNYSRLNSSAEAGEWFEVEERDGGPSNRLLSRRRHFYFDGDAAGSLYFYTGEVHDGVSEPLWGKEVKAERLATDGSDKVLTRVETAWEPGCVGPPDGTPWSPYVKESVQSILEASTNSYKVSKQEFAYDRYNNQTGVKVYDFGAGAALGAGAPGALLSRTQTIYLTVNGVNGVDYSSPAPTAGGVYLRHLPEQTSVYDAVDKERSRVTFEYDNYTPDASHRHEALVPRPDISGLCAFFDAGVCHAPNDPGHSPASYVTRGNLTQTTNFLLDKDGGVLSSVSAYSQYDVAGNLVKLIDPLDRATSYGFSDRFGSPDGEARNNTAPPELGNMRSYALPTEVMNALGHASYMQYDYFTGRVVNAEDANGTVSSAIYDDDFERPTRADRAVNVPALHSQSTFIYDDASRTITTTSDLNSLSDNLLKSVSVYDGLGRTVETRRFEGSTQYVATLTKYDALGRACEVSNPHRPSAGESPVWTKSEFDALGRPLTVTSPDGAKVYTLYDGVRTLVTDQAGKQRISLTDALGRLTSVWEVVAQSSMDPAVVAVSFPVPQEAAVPAVSKAYQTSYTYDVLGNLRKVAQGGQMRYFAYDSLSRLIRVRNPEQDASDALALPAGLLSPLSDDNNGWSQKYEYFDDGQLKKRIDARGVVADYTYDDLGRVKTQTYSGEAGAQTPTVTYMYDDPSVPFSKGRLTSVTSSASTYSYTAYDELGRVKGSSQQTGSAAYLMPDYRYDLAGNLTSMQYPSGKVVKTEYDAAGRVAGVKDSALGLYYAGAAPSDQVNRIQYAAHGAVSAVRLGNNLWEHTNFNSRLQPEEIGLGTSRTDSGKMQLTYGYGPAGSNNGNVRSQKIAVPGSFALTQTYEYDTLNRLEVARETNDLTPCLDQNGAPSDCWRQKFAYDRFGNRALVGGAGATTYPAGLDATNNPSASTSNNRFTSPGYSYDAAGNLLCDPLHPCAQGQSSLIPYYSYDAEGRMCAAGAGVEGGGTSYTYDGMGRRVRKAVPQGESTVFVYDAGSRLIAEYSNIASGSGTSYLSSDTLGSTRAVTDGAGQVKSRRDYFPFGEEISSGIGGRTTSQGYSQFDGVRQGFTGKERDNETRLDYFGARYYGSIQGRFTSPDPLLASGDVEIPQSWNRYSYTLNNPLLYTDPLGLYVFDKSVSQDEQDRFNAGLEKAKDNLKKIAQVYGDKSAEYKAAKRALDVYGEKGVDNGVIIVAKNGAGDGRTLVDGVAGKKTDTNPTGQRIQVQFDHDSFKDQDFDEMIGHEGSHAADGSDWVASGFSESKRPSLYQTEVDAYVVSSLLTEANTPNRTSPNYYLPAASAGRGRAKYLWEPIWLYSASWAAADKATLRRSGIDSLLARPKDKGGFYGLTPASKEKAFTKGYRHP